MIVINKQCIVDPVVVISLAHFPSLGAHAHFPLLSHQDSKKRQWQDRNIIID